jgi:apolipoprotein N-acyltransferase
MNDCAKRTLLSISSAPLLALSQPFSAAVPLALIALVPWFYDSRRSTSFQAITTGALVGTVYGCIWASWIPKALQGLGASAAGATAGLVLAAAWAKLPLFALLGLALSSVRQLPTNLQVLAVAAFVYLGEWLIEISSLGVPVALIGHTQSDLIGVAQVAVVGGVPLLSSWVVAINFAIALAISGDLTARRVAVTLFTAWLVTVVFGLPLAKALRATYAVEPSLSLLIVQPDLPRGERWVAGMQGHNLKSVASYTNRVLDQIGNDVDAVVWPENMITSPIDQRPLLSQTLQHWVDRWKTPLITGMVRSSIDPGAKRYRSSVLWIAPKRGVVDAIDKQRAIPLIESSRELAVFQAIEPLLGRAAQWPRVEEMPSAGPLSDGFEIVPVLCYEALFPRLVADRRGPLSAAILNLADDSWVKSETLTRQLVDIAAFRAIEQRLTLIRVAHGGLSAVVSPFGERLAELPLDEYAHRVVTVSPSPPPTLLERASIAALPILSGVITYWLSGVFIIVCRRTKLD